MNALVLIALSRPYTIVVLGNPNRSVRQTRSPAHADGDLPRHQDPGCRSHMDLAPIFRAEGTQVAVVDTQNRVHLRSVTLGENLGQMVQVTSGISSSDSLVNNPPVGLLERQLVQPVSSVSTQTRADAVTP
jgi:hypothetical protein